MTTPVSFEIAKLLKDKGFDEPTKIWHQRGDGIVGCVEGQRDFFNRKGDVYTSAPTIAEAIMWLYEKHGIWISGFSTDDVSMFSYKISSKQGHNYSPNYNSPTEAYEAAIEYVLTKILG